LIRLKLFYQDLALPFGFSFRGFVAGNNLVATDCCTSDEICLPDIYFNDTNFESNNFNASDAIYAIGQVNNNETVIFKAGEFVSLNPNFAVNQNANFNATINNCDTISFVDFCNLSAPTNFQLTSLNMNTANLTWQNVIGANGYGINYTVNDTTFVSNSPSINNSISIPIAPIPGKHEFTVSTFCATQVGNPQGETIALENVNATTANNVNCDVPTNLNVTLNGPILDVSWDADPNALDYIFIIQVNGSNVFSENDFVGNNLMFNIPNYNGEEVTILLASNCSNGETSAFAIGTVVCVVDIPDAIDNVCENRTNKDVFTECFNAEMTGKFNCAHYKNITKDEFIKCHCDPNYKKPKKEFSETCP